MNLVQNLENSGELEEIYRERERYLLNVDDLLEEILSDSQIEVEERIDFPADQQFSNKYDSEINAEIDIPVSIVPEFNL